MVFFTKNAVNHDSHHVISNKKITLKINHFEHQEIVGLADVANWSDYPKRDSKGY